MLDIRHNRLDYGRLLIPPEGFALSQAVATCYSVDLDTLLSIPVALYYAQTLEGNLQGKDVQIIRAIQHSALLLRVYHQEGQVKVPHSAKDIYAYFEDSLVAVLPESAFTSFHPKTWILRYENVDSPERIVYRFIVLSRNLTFDRRWDVAAFLEGKPASKIFPRNQPLVDFLHWLDGRHKLDHRDILFDELPRVDFSVPDEFDSFKLHPIGIRGYETNPTATHKANRLLCISPFLHRKALETLVANSTDDPMILSTSAELERLPSHLLESLQAYCLSELVVDGERRANAEEGDGEPLEQDLHAKLFLFDHDSVTTWFLGSGNATLAAFERNVEFMIELKGSSPGTRFAKVYKQLLGNDETAGLFREFAPNEGGKDDEAEQRRQTALRLLEYSLLAAETQGTVVDSANQVTFDLTLNLDFRAVKKSSLIVKVRPFVRDLEEQTIRLGELNVLQFPNISETSISRFVQYTIYDHGEVIRDFLVRIPISGIPSTRLANIFKSIIDSRDKFFLYLHFLLTDELSKEDFEAPSPKKGKHSTNGPGWVNDMPIFEQLLVTASRNPHRLREIDRAISNLQGSEVDGVIPSDFLSLWEVFKAAMPPAEVNDG